MDMVCQTSELPQLESSCSPGSAEMYVEPTRWQRLRAVAQTRSLLPSETAIKALPTNDGPYALHVSSSPLSHFAIDSLPPQGTGTLNRPAQAASARARVLLQSQHVCGVTDSLDADLQVEAVLQKAANRAARLAGLPKAPPCSSKVLAALQPCSPATVAAADQKVSSYPLFCLSYLSLACASVLQAFLQQQHRPCLQAVIKTRPHVARQHLNDLRVPPEHQAYDLPSQATTTHGSASSGGRSGQQRQIAPGIRRKSAATADHARQQCIMQALQKQRLKQLAVGFEFWSAEAKQGQVHLRGATSMLQWRKLLRIWKV